MASGSFDMINMLRQPSTAAVGIVAQDIKKAGKKRDRNDKAVQEKVPHAIHDSQIFNSFLEFQHHVDDLISVRRNALREALHRPDHVKARMRITVTHTLQPQQAAGGEPGVVLHIHGRTLELDAAGPGQPGTLASGQPGTTGTDAAALAAKSATGQGQTVAAVQGHQTIKYPLTAYLRRVEVQLSPDNDTGAQGDKDGGTDASMAGTTQQGTTQQPSHTSSIDGWGSRSVIWDRASHVGPHKDSLELRWRGIPPTGWRVHVTIVMDQQPERYLLPEQLAAKLGIAAETKPRAMQALHQYLKQQRLVDQHQVVHLPSDLAQVFGGVTEAPLAQLLGQLVKLLQPCKPVVVDHIIRPIGDTTSQPQEPAQVYDVECEPLPPFNPNVERQAYALLETHNPDKELDPIDSDMAAMFSKLAERRRRRAVLLGFAQSPVEFTAGLLATQARDVRVTKGQSLADLAQQLNQSLQANAVASAMIQPAFHSIVAFTAAANAKELEVQRRTDLFKGKWVEDAVATYLERKAQRQQFKTNQ